MDFGASNAALRRRASRPCLSVRFRRIPNWLTGSVCAAGLVLNACCQGPWAAPDALAGAGCRAGVLLPSTPARNWRRRREVVGRAWMRWSVRSCWYLSRSLVVSLAVYVDCGTHETRSAVAGAATRCLYRVGRRRRSGAKAPYGVAIACGYPAALLMPGCSAEGPWDVDPVSAANRDRRVRHPGPCCSRLILFRHS